MARKYLDTTGLTALWAKIINKINALGNSLASVAFSGSYNDLTNKPTVAEIDDTSTANNKAWSASKIGTDLGGKVSKTGDSMTGSLDLLGSELHLKTNSSSSNDSGDIIWFYGNGQEKARIWTENSPTTVNAGRISFRCYKSDGTALLSAGKLATSSDVDGKVSKSGDTATGKITFNAGIAIKAGSEISNPPFFLTLNEAFADGGNVGWKPTSSMADTIGAVKKSGDTMTGQLVTSFGGCVAMGSRESKQSTIPNLCNELRFSSGCCGSVSITTAYTKDGVTIPSSWYNYLYIPHRSGGVNGQASGDNCSYGTLILSNMTGNTEPFFIRIKSSSDYVSNLYKIASANPTGISFSVVSGNVTNQAMTANRMSNVICVSGYFSLNATVAANTVLYNNLPKPYNNCRQYFWSNGADFKLETDGSIRTNSQRGVGTYQFNFSYICA